jgi:hypothetical protein
MVKRVVKKVVFRPGAYQTGSEQGPCGQIKDVGRFFPQEGPDCILRHPVFFQVRQAEWERFSRQDHLPQLSFFAFPENGA